MLWRSARAVLRTRRPLIVELSGPEGAGRSRLVGEFTRAKIVRVEGHDLVGVPV